MELMFLWIMNDGKTIKCQPFNFSNQYRFELLTNDDREYKLVIKDNQKYLENFFSSPRNFLDQGTETRISNVTAIIGENGAGKSNLLSILIEILSNKQLLLREHVVVFKNHKSGDLVVYHNLQKTTISIKNDSADGKGIKLVEQKVTYPLGKNHQPYIAPERSSKNSKVIFYSPTFDINEYPPTIDNDSKGYIDVSTNSLVYEDNFYSGTYTSENDDRVLNYKRANVLRQIELTQFASADENLKNFVPTEAKIFFQKNFSIERDIEKNLSTNSRTIFELIDKKIDQAFDKAHSYKDIAKKDVLTFGKSNDGLSKDIEYKKAQVETIKIDFIQSFVQNFFKNISKEPSADIKLNPEFLEDKNLFEIANHLFANQKANGKNKNTIIPTKELYEEILNIIDSLVQSKYQLNSDSNFAFADIDKVKLVTKLYYKYLDSIPTNFKKSFLSFSWRNLSSGENAILDLYSRLFYAFNEKLKKVVDENVSFIYILIDEGEIGLHPQWQKEYLFKLLDFVNELFKNYHVQIILTSHSPFLVSDLPKSNLIFLEKIDGLTQVVDPGIEETFAGNIHELLTDKFFIKGGVMGEYSKYKINQELVDIFKNQFPIRDVERVKKFISLIGEPVLRKQLLEVIEKKK